MISTERNKFISTLSDAETIALLVREATDPPWKGRCVPLAEFILAALRERGYSKDEWLPIESAPRDGSHFLAYWQAPLAENGEIIVAKWSEMWDGYHGVNVQDLQGRSTLASLISGFSDNPTLHATHWRPLPPAPQTEAER